MKFLKRIFSPTESQTTYDNIAIEPKSLFINNSNKNVKFEFTKSIFPGLQITNLLLLNNVDPSDIDSKKGLSRFWQTTGTMTNNVDTLIQTTINQEKSTQIRFTKVIRDWLNIDFHSMVTRRDGVYSQLEINLKQKFNNISLKTVNPTFQNAKPMFIGNMVQSINKNLEIGCEMIYSQDRGDLGISAASRHIYKNSITVFNIQNFNTLNISYLRKINNFFNIGIDLYKSIRETENVNGKIGLELKTVKAGVKIDIDNKFISRIRVEEKIFDGFYMNLDGEVDLINKTQTFGISFSLDN